MKKTMPRLYISLITTLAIGVVASTSTLATPRYRPTALPITLNLLLAASTNNSRFVSVEHPTEGQVSLSEKNGVRYLEFSEDFQSDRGPDLKVILHKANSVELKVQEGDYITLGALKSFNGAQRYLVPEDVDLSQYQAVAIWCQQFNATFGYAPLVQ